MTAVEPEAPADAAGGRGESFPGAVPIRAGVRGVATARVVTIGERQAVLLRIDAGAARGALAETDGDTLAAGARIAHDKRLPLVAIIASSGADISEGVSAVAGWGRAAREIVRCSGVVPLVFVVDGPAVSGPALLLGLADHVIMVEDSYAFVSGPNMVREFTGVPVSNADLGGVAASARSNGIASVTVADLDEALEVASELLSFLPSHLDELPPAIPTDDPPHRPTPEAGDLIPDAAMASFDVRDVIRTLVDDEYLLELRTQWAPNMVTGLASIAGRPVGLVANQPQSIAGTLDIPASQKGARFVAFCDAFNLPLVTLVDTSGFYPGKDLEWRGMIRHGAQLAFAYARATVPRIALILRKSYGGAYIVMDSKYMGNDLMMAWPSAEIAVMGAKGAVEILHRRADADERQRLEEDYEARLLNPYVAAERGSVDAVIEPDQTRSELASALDLLATKRERLVGRRHDNTPL
ncbi:MAG: methylmalonyl-CoA carboxyltransferase [Actinomycetia bacterium]|nr:methylmalonyl-CoA carboxyltransferase [Actinomycetes bacterium]MCP3912683.1 methylmalonyl-CoA carboxyltransferase [Actinomycetes bacterium]MCP4087885.1 methylmalonyl-CoA carboxyltransferase [Actinomycetes bacterium]